MNITNLLTRQPINESERAYRAELQAAARAFWTERQERAAEKLRYVLTHRRAPS